MSMSIKAITVSMVLAFSGIARADQPARTIYVSVEQNGKPVAGLNAANFRVFIDGKGREFDLRSRDQSANIVLMVEYSRQSWLFLNDIRNVLSGFLEYAPEGNWYALVTVGRKATIAVDFTKDKRRIASAFYDLPVPIFDDVAAFDALSEIVDTASALPGRNAIMFIGSGFDNFSSASYGDVENVLESSDVSIYSLAIGSPLRGFDSSTLGLSTEVDLLGARQFLTMLADQSGGDAWFPVVEVMFRNAVQRIMLDLATQYKLEIKGALPSDDRLHKIKVEAFTITNDKRKNFKVRVRDGLR